MTAMPNLFSAHTTAEFKRKRSACEQGLLSNGNKDKSTGNWIVISSSDDLFHHDIDVDFAQLDYKPLLINESNHYNAQAVKVKLS